MYVCMFVKMTENIIYENGRQYFYENGSWCVLVKMADDVY